MSGLKARILSLIRENGPIDVARYMQTALTDPEAGYYMRRDPIGRDFITAPEISQIFGEMIGLFFVQAWEDRSKPQRFHFVELGPGRGTLMADMIRAAKIRPAFLGAANIALIETSPYLREVQAKTLCDTSITWRQDLHDIPDDAPLFLIANEFFDALPIQQFIKMKDRWHERTIGAGGDALIFVPSADPVPDTTIPAHLRDAPDGSVFETSPQSRAIAREIARRIARQGGIALFIDYGHAESGLGDTFQALKAGRFADPLADPGEADLTAHVDFAALAKAAHGAGAALHGPIPQGRFLEALGIRVRAERLKGSTPDNAHDIDAATERLIAPAQMGTLFKAMAICQAHSSGVPGFPC